VSERERSDTQELELDLLQDQPSGEESGDDRGLPPGGGSGGTGGPGRDGGSRRPPEGGRGLLRLVLLIGGAILLAVILVLWVNSCREDTKREGYSGYLEEVTPIASESEQIGKDLTKLVTTPGITLNDLQTGLEGLRRQEEQLVARATGLRPPGPLRDQQDSLLEALQFRVSGLGGLAQAFGTIDETTDSQVAGRLLQQQSARLLTSDVVYDDLFKAGAESVMKQESVSGVAVPASTFITDANAELLSAESWALLVERVAQGSTPSGLVGTSLESLTVLPAGEALSPDEENTVTASEQLAFEVRVQNSGDAQLTQVPVQLTLQLAPEPVQKQGTIDILDPGDTKSVVFRNFDIAGSFGTLVTLKVSVEPVDGEENTANNTAEYSVIFTLG
jgi:hypothetical protein